MRLFLLCNLSNVKTAWTIIWEKKSDLQSNLYLAAPYQAVGFQSPPPVLKAHLKQTTQIN